MTPHLFQIVVFLLYSLVLAQYIDPHLQIRGAALGGGEEEPKEEKDESEEQD